MARPEECPFVPADSELPGWAVVIWQRLASLLPAQDTVCVLEVMARFFPENWRTGACMLCGRNVTVGSVRKGKVN